MKKFTKRLFLLVLIITLVCVVFTAGCSRSQWFVRTVKNNYYYEIDEQAFEETDYKEFAKKYLDRYSAYYTESEYKELLKSNAGSKSGLGLSYSYVDGKGIYVASVTGNSPAYMCGLTAGEWIISGCAESGEEVVFSSSQDFQNLVNSVGDGVNLTFTSTDGDEYCMAKSEFTASYAYMCTNDTLWTFGDSANGGLALYENKPENVKAVPQAVGQLPDGTAYMRLSQFYGGAASEFNILIGKFNQQNCNSLIIDLRSNGGGYVSVMQEIAYCFSGSTKQLAMLSADKNGTREKFYCVKNKSANIVPEGIEIYVLANSGTASASEALIGAMVSYGVLDYENIFLSQYSDEYLGWLEESGQELKTAQTYGKGIMQSTFVNSFTGEALKLTTAKIYWPDMTTSIHDRGVTVDDGCIAVPVEWQHTKTDDELKTVIGIIQSR